MKPGTIVTYATKNPTSKTSRIGIVVEGTSDFGPEYLLIADGATSLEQANESGISIISRRRDELTELAPSIAKNF